MHEVIKEISIKELLYSVLDLAETISIEEGCSPDDIITIMRVEKDVYCLSLSIDIKDVEKNFTNSEFHKSVSPMLKETQWVFIKYTRLLRVIKLASLTDSYNDKEAIDIIVKDMKKAIKKDNNNLEEMIELHKKLKPKEPLGTFYNDKRKNKLK